MEPREEQGEAWSGWAEVEAVEEPGGAREAGWGELGGCRPGRTGRAGEGQRGGSRGGGALEPWTSAAGGLDPPNG